MDAYLEDHLRGRIKDLEDEWNDMKNLGLWLWEGGVIPLFTERDELREELKEFARFTLEKKKIIDELRGVNERLRSALETLRADVHTMTRTEFEKFLAAPPFDKNLARWPNDARYAWPGQYKDYAVQLAWEVVQEADRQRKALTNAEERTA